MSRCLSAYFLDVFKGAVDVWFRRAQNCLLGSVCRAGWSANTLCYQAVFGHVSLRGDPKRFCPVWPCPSPVLKYLLFYLLSLPLASPHLGTQPSRGYLVIFLYSYYSRLSDHCKKKKKDKKKETLLPLIY